MNILKIIIPPLIILICVFILEYLIISLILGTFNIWDWNTIQRSALIFLTLMVWISILYGLYKQAVRDEKAKIRKIVDELSIASRLMKIKAGHFKQDSTLKRILEKIDDLKKMYE